jgi:hypothetical protein
VGRWAGPWNEFVEGKDGVAVVVIHPQNLSSQMLLTSTAGTEISGKRMKDEDSVWREKDSTHKNISGMSTCKNPFLALVTPC